MMHELERGATSGTIGLKASELAPAWFSGFRYEAWPAPSHPRVYGAFTRKLRQCVLDQEHIAMPFAMHSIATMTGLAAEFLHLEDRGFLREGYVADIAVLDRERIRDLATYEDPKQYSEGTVHVLVNGELAIRDGGVHRERPRAGE